MFLESISMEKIPSLWNTHLILFHLASNLTRMKPILKILFVISTSAVQLVMMSLIAQHHPHKILIAQLDLLCKLFFHDSLQWNKHCCKLLSAIKIIVTLRFFLNFSKSEVHWLSNFVQRRFKTFRSGSTSVEVRILRWTSKRFNTQVSIAPIRIFLHLSG